jgi:long-subunit acyl-CoA synthetase (AMP-forming)
VESKLEVVDHQITAIGKYLASKGAKRVAIYLPNSIEFAAALFACSFQLITPILVPFDQPPATLISMLRDAGADTVIAVPGVFPVDAVAAALQDLRHVIWVADEGNMHLDWDDAPADHIDVATWHDIVAATPKQEDEGGHDKQAVPPEVVTFWTTRDAASGNEKHQVVAFSQANLVAAIAGQAESLPAMTPEDVVLPADSLASAHTLVVTLAALFSNASVAFNAAACRHPDLAQLTDPDVLCPSIIIASPTTLVKAHADYITKLGSSLFARFSHWSLTKSLLHDGRMPSSSVAGRGVVGAGLRLIITADRAGSGMTPALSPSILSDLRISTGARIVYALTASPVAGAVAQTMAFDYRVAEGESKPHFGGPPRCLRYMLKDTPAVKNSDEKYQGDIFVQGPCVAGGEASLGVVGTVRSDNTLAYA